MRSLTGTPPDFWSDHQQADSVDFFDIVRTPEESDLYDKALDDSELDALLTQCVESDAFLRSSGASRERAERNRSWNAERLRSYHRDLQTEQANTETRRVTTGVQADNATRERESKSNRSDETIAATAESERDYQQPPPPPPPPPPRPPPPPPSMKRSRPENGSANKQPSAQQPTEDRHESSEQQLRDATLRRL